MYTKALFLCLLFSLTFSQQNVIKAYTYHWRVAQAGITINPFINPDLKYLGNFFILNFQVFING